MNLTEAEAQKIVTIVREQASKIGKPVSIALVDAGGFTVSVVRMDGARPMTPSLALAKSYSSAVMQRPSHRMIPLATNDPVFFSQVATMGLHPIVATLGGGTLKIDGEVIGGIGVSGGTGEEDQAICDAVIEAMGFETGL